MIATVSLRRSRLTARLNRAFERPATLICAREGFGKTTAIRQFFEAHPAKILEFGLLPEHGSLVAFARALADTLAPVAPGLRSSFARAIEFALQSDQPDQELAIWVLGHIDRDAERTILIDDLHHASSDERIFNLIERLIKDSPRGYRWLISSRSLPPEVERWRGQGLCLAPIDESDLRFTESEMREISQASGLSPGTGAALYRMTEGWPLAFSLGCSMPQWIERLQVLRPGSAEGLYAFFAEQFFLQCDPQLQKLLLHTCVLAKLDTDFIAETPWSDAWVTLQWLAQDGRLVSFRHDGSVQLRDLFRDFLEHRLEESSETTIGDSCTFAAGLLENCGRVADALRLYTRAGNDLGILHLCERYGFAMVDEGRLDDLQSALASLDSETAAQSAVALAVRAIAASHASQSDIAESWYLHAIERAQNPVLRAEIAYRYGLDLVRHGRRDGIDLLERHIGGPLPTELDASLRASLATAYVLVERFDDARRMMTSAVALLDRNSSKQLQAKIHHHAAWVSLFTGQISTAKSSASLAVQLALECDMYEVAARAYSVLYNVSYDVEDNPKTSLEILDRILDCGLKAGSKSMRLFALLGTIDLRAEIGDAESLAAIEQMIDAHGIDYSDKTTSETLLPAEALTLAARGRFAKAYELIFPTGERQVTDDRRALRFSEIAFYAAAGGLYSEAEAALLEVQARLRECEQSARRTLRTQLYRALATRLLGRSAEARAILDFVGGFSGIMSARLHALYNCVSAIFSHWDGIDNYNEIYDTLRALRLADFGGVAAAIASLPSVQEEAKSA